MMLRAMSDQMRALFEADPDNTNGNTKAGRRLIREMEDVVKRAGREKVGAGFSSEPRTRL